MEWSRGEGNAAILPLHYIDVVEPGSGYLFQNREGGMDEDCRL